MWPFSKIVKAEVKRDPAPCGNDKEHYFWTESQGWPCPVCASMRDRAKKRAEEEERNERLAIAIAKHLEV